MKKISTLILLFFTACIFAQPVGWMYNQPITVSNPNSGAAIDYQLRLTLNTQSLIAASQMNSAGNDIRFGGTCTGNAFFNYWIESGINTASTVIWVKIPLIAANSFTTIFMFYGNSGAAAASAVQGTFRGPNSSTDSVSGGNTNALVANSQRGFRFQPTQDMLVTHFGKNEPTGTQRYITLFNFNTQAQLAQIQVAGAAATYTYGALASPLWLTSGTQYVLQQFQGSNDGYYYQTSSQIGQHMTYLDMRYCNSCTQNTFPNTTLANYHYGYPDLWYYITNTLAITPTYTLGGSLISISGPNSICSGNTVTLTTNASGSFSWSTGSTATAIAVSPTVNTTYSVAESNSVGCNSNAFLTMTVFQGIPVISVANTASNSGGICPGQTVALTATGAPNYTWTGNVVNGISFQPQSPSGYTVTAQNACGTTTAATSVSVHPLPPVTASASQPTVCSGVSVTVVGGGASTYTWSPSNISNGVAFFPTVTQSYSVIGTSALGCTASAVTSISVTTTPILAPIATPTRICVGETATITASGAASYSWSPGNQNTSAITVTPGTTSTYTLLKWNDNCFDSKTITVLVDPLPTVLAFANPSTICLYNTTTLQAGGGTSYTWSPQGGQGPNSFTTVVSPPQTTNYTVTAFDGSCTSTGTVDVIVNQNPTITVSASSSVICQGDPVNLTVSGASNYQWSNNLGTASSVTDYPSGPTLYTVSGTNASNCTAVVSQVVLVNPLPVITTTVIAPLVCEGGTSTLSASGAATYTWNAGTNNTGPVTVVNTNSNTIYTVTGSYTTGCINTKTVMVSVFEPTFAVSSNTSVCFGGSVTLVASAANSYTWVNGPQAPSYLVSPPAKTVYTVMATSNSGSVSCTSSKTVEVDIYLNPVVTAVATRTSICRNESVDLNANGALNYSWNNNMTGSTITVSPFSTTNYTVTGTDQFGCKNTATVQVRVQTCVGIDENVAGKTLSIYPNPNKGEFTIETKSAIHLLLVNELGQLIREFEVSEQNNYKVHIKDLAKGVYFLFGENENHQVRQKIIVE